MSQCAVCHGDKPATVSMLEIKAECACGQASAVYVCVDCLHGYANHLDSVASAETYAGLQFEGEVER